MKENNKPFKAAVLTISDSASSGGREDLSGPETSGILEEHEIQVVQQKVLPDDAAMISTELIRLADEDQLNLVVTTGGTGFSPRDVTPEATERVIDRRADNLSQLMRMVTAKITPLASLSRGIAGIRKQTLIINLPGSPKGARENLEAVVKVLDHALRHLRGEILH